MMDGAGTRTQIDESLRFRWLPIAYTRPLFILV